MNVYVSNKGWVVYATLSDNFVPSSHKLVDVPYWAVKKLFKNGHNVAVSKPSGKGLDSQSSDIANIAKKLVACMELSFSWKQLHIAMKANECGPEKLTRILGGV